MPTALIVDDEPEANKLLAMLVTLRGYRTRSAFTGSEALEIARSDAPDVVFLDLMLPDANGFEVCRALRAEGPTGAIPVVMVTARLAEENRDQSLKAGATAYVPKPYTPDQIFRARAAADAWRRDLGTQADRGRFAVGPATAAETYAAARRLTALWHARARLDPAALAGLAAALEEICGGAIDWGHRRGIEEVAEVAHELTGSRLGLTVRDLGGWFAGSQRSAEQRLAKAIALGGFDRVEEDQEAASIALSRPIEAGG